MSEQRKAQCVTIRVDDNKYPTKEYELIYNEVERTEKYNLVEVDKITDDKLLKLRYVIFTNNRFILHYLKKYLSIEIPFIGSAYVKDMVGFKTLFFVMEQYSDKDLEVLRSKDNIKVNEGGFVE